MCSPFQWWFSKVSNKTVGRSLEDERNSDKGGEERLFICTPLVQEIFIHLCLMLHSFPLNAYSEYQIVQQSHD